MFNTPPFVVSFAFLLSISLLFLLAPRILPPKHVRISLPDELDDLDLFRRATLFSLSEKAHHGRRYHNSHHHHHHHRISVGTIINPLSLKPKIAFLFLTNSDLQFAPLWEIFFVNNTNLYNIYIHADPKVKISSPGGVFDGRFIHSKRTERSSPTLISAARRLLATALLDDPRNAYFALISQHCIPVHSFQFIYNSLFSFPLDQSTPPKSPIFRSFIEILSDEPQLWDRYIARGENSLSPEIPFNKFRIGSQFFILTRQHSLLVIKDRKLWRKFRLPCLDLDNCYPEEHYFPTLLSMEDPNGCTHYSLTRVNWTGSSGGHPHTYRPDEISNELINSLRDSNSSLPFMFARKFSPDFLNPLIHIAQNSIFFSSQLKIKEEGQSYYPVGFATVGRWLTTMYS